MAEEKVDLRDVSVRQLLTWTALFRGFQVALDPKKLLLAAAGILTMAFGWWLLAIIFYSPRTKPDWPGSYTPYIDKGYKEVDLDKENNRTAGTTEAWKQFQKDLSQWSLLYKAAGTAPQPGKPRVDLPEAADLAQTPEEYARIQKDVTELRSQIEKNNLQAVVVQDKVYELRRVPIQGKDYDLRPRPYGALRSWPWWESRGPNPFLLVTGQTGEAGSASAGGWEKGRFLEWFVTEQLPVLLEPLVKFLRPVAYFLSPSGGFLERLYFFLVIVWTLATWALFGGAITRMASVQIARREKIDMSEAIRFTLSRYLSFLSAPLFPMLFVLFLVVMCMLFTVVHAIPGLGDLFDGLFFFLLLIAGLVMAVVLVGLVGWPMMYATISAEGSDSFDALSRSYSYVYQSPWHYLWYGMVALVYGAVLVFFVGLMGSMTVYLAKWGMSQNPLATWVNREPSYLFVYAPESFGWRNLLLQGSDYLRADGSANPEAYRGWNFFNYAGAVMVAGWLYLVFLIILGFGYSYFWTAGTLIYLLMRHHVEDTELDEVYLEEDEGEDAYAPSPQPETSPPMPSPGPSITMVESPTLKTPSSTAPSPSGNPGGGDGSPPTASGGM